MSSSIFHPPNAHLLSDGIIGSVSARTKSYRSAFDTRQRVGERAMFTASKPPQAPVAQPFPEPTVGTAPSGKLSPDIGLTPSTERKRKIQQLSEQPKIHSFTAGSNPSSPQGEAPVTCIQRFKQSSTVEKIQRELRRRKQARYRKKQSDHMMNLEKENEQLQQEVERLKRRRFSTTMAFPPRENLWSAALEYFRLFRHGLQEPKMMSLLSEEDKIQSRVQMAFFQSTMAPDVVFNADQGIDKMIQYWNFLSYAFKDMEIELKRMMQENEDSLVATSVTSVTISEQTLLAVFPHLSNEDTPELDETKVLLRQALVNQRITMLGSIRFEWDAINGQVTSVSIESDMLTPMLHLLGNLEDVSRVFADALLSLDFQWRPKANNLSGNNQ
ncbi:hypothetical protein PPTG_15241 [Phytophthora nicotianae INRA-310]|uniref:BZIP domain-containing protein n=2 Tax=Phytophthora nicotianae TaxID=4792 RepID=W2PUN5_PHYN3|nr:hypothetical protein PPTG_15241 [Phytophthora nicotianae INRA-310]ETN03924.1 hypothetical protein PPTG_15241 [Phytophthora nicotianae INRA-310]